MVYYKKNFSKLGLFEVQLYNRLLFYYKYLLHLKNY